MEQSRRRFVVASAVAVGLTLLAGGVFMRMARRYRGLPVKLERLEYRLARLRYARLPLDEALVQYYSYLDLDRQGIDQFVRDFHRWAESSGRVPTFDEAIERYLLSTDFFLHNADQSRRVRYRQMYDPHGHCDNPFAERGSPLRARLEETIGPRTL